MILLPMPTIYYSEIRRFYENPVAMNSGILLIVLQAFPFHASVISLSLSLKNP